MAGRTLKAVRKKQLPDNEFLYDDEWESIEIYSTIFFFGGWTSISPISQGVSTEAPKAPWQVSQCPTRWVQVEPSSTLNIYQKPWENPCFSGKMIWKKGEGIIIGVTPLNWRCSQFYMPKRAPLFCAKLGHDGPSSFSPWGCIFWTPGSSWDRAEQLMVGGCSWCSRDRFVGNLFIHGIKPYKTLKIMDGLTDSNDQFCGPIPGLTCKTLCAVHKHVHDV